MIIDNTALIRKLLVFPPKNNEEMLEDQINEEQRKERQQTGNRLCIDQRDCFYVVQLLQRQKDNPMKQYLINPNFRNNSNRTIQQFQIYSLDDWDMKLSVIIDLAKYYNCRVYIDLNLKDSKDVYAKLYENMATRFRTSNYRKLHRLYNEAVGQTPCMKGTRKTWVVDIDTKDQKFIDEVRGFILTLFGNGKREIEGPHGKLSHLADVLAEIPTKNGVHLITTSFQVDAFRKKFRPGTCPVDILTANPTIAWMETDWGHRGE